MTIKYEITKMYRKKAIIPVDSYSYQDYIKGINDTLEIKVLDQWVNIKPPIKEYKLYSHSYSPNGLKKAMEQMR